MIDYHVHLWPHEQRAESDDQRVERLAAYCELAARRGVREIAVTEHFFRFRAAAPLVASVRDSDPARQASIDAYFAHHCTADLDAYVDAVLAAKRAGLPIVLGLEVDHYRGRMAEVSDLLSGYPFDVLLGSVHWIGGWMFDVLDEPSMASEWGVRGVERAWRDYVECLEELAGSGACDVLAHPDLAKVSGARPDDGLRRELEERIAQAAAATSMAAELSSAGWRKPAGEQYPSRSLLSRLADLGVPLTTASDSHGTAHIAERVGELAHLAAAAGYSSLRAFRRRAGVDVPLVDPAGPAAKDGESHPHQGGAPRHDRAGEQGVRETSGAPLRGAATSRRSPVDGVHVTAPVPIVPPAPAPPEPSGEASVPPAGDHTGAVSPADLARRYTGLDIGARKHLERLLASWALLADLSFSDLLLYVPLDEHSLAVTAPGVLAPPPPAEAEEGKGADPLRAGEGGAASAAVEREPLPPPGDHLGGHPAVRAPRDEAASRRQPGPHFVVLGQVRPSTNPTLLSLDLVGQVVEASELPVVSECWRLAAVTAGERAGEDGVVRVQCIPVRWAGEVVAVLARHWSPSTARRSGGLERTYVQLFQRLALMVATGHFPFLSDQAAVEESPRVGDGVVVLDAEQRITFASPNAVNALHRMGIVSAIVGSSLARLGLALEAVDIAYSGRLPVTEEVERRPDVIVIVRVIPLVEEGAITGAAVLVRDVSDLRRRDRLLLSKDVAIREVHHRVKNNLQTISALLRLQSRRLVDPAARNALAEAERRIRAIALVHEILSREPGEQVPFGEIVPALTNLARDAGPAGRSVTMIVHGEPGDLPADIATPLAVVIAELLQNAVEHAFAGGFEGGSEGGAGGPGQGAAPSEEGQGAAEWRPPRGGEVVLSFRSRHGALEIDVRDNGSGFPPGFDLDSTPSLGLAIVRDLVRSQLGGSIAIESSDGAVVRLTVPAVLAATGLPGAGGSG